MKVGFCSFSIIFYLKFALQLIIIWVIHLLTHSSIHVSMPLLGTCTMQNPTGGAEDREKQIITPALKEPLGKDR